MKIFITILCLSMFFSHSYAQRFFKDRLTLQKSQIESAPAEFKYIPKKTGHYTAEDWATVIDITWGPGLSTQEKLAIFDKAWNNIDAKYAAFQ